MVAAGRARLGVLIPSANLLTEPDMYRMAPTGVTVHFARMRFTGDSPEQFRRMLDDLPKSSESLSDGRMDAYAFACTTGTMLEEDDVDAQIIARIEQLTGRPATTTAAAVLEAFRVLGVRCIAIATPYEEWLNKKEREFFERNGINVVAIEGLGVSSAEEKARQPLETVYALARAIDRAEAEAVFISCAGLPAVELLHRLENDLGKPVVSSNQATMWKLLRLCSVAAPVHGFGRLLLRR